MNLERLRWGEWIAGIAGLDLLLVTFRSWYKVTGTGAHVTAWDALHTGRYLLLATAVVGIFLFLIQASEDAARISFPPGWIAAVVGFACTVYVGYRLASPPSDALDPDVGIYIGLAGALGVTLGGLLSAREAPALAAAPIANETPADTGPSPETIGGLVPDTGTNTWSPASPVPAPATSGWSPASPAVAAVPPATAAGAGLAEEERPLRPGDQVTLTAGGARFPAGTVADVVEVFGGGALVEVKAPDGVAERFEVPESAFERGISAPPTGAASRTTSGGSWSPALPAAAAAGDDWGFDDPGDGAATATEPVDRDGPAEKVPWYKREIGGGKKKKAEMAAAAGAGAAAAAAIATHDGEADTGTEEKPSFFKRLFGGGAKQEAATEETAEVTADEPDAEPEAAESAAPEPEAEVPGPEPDPEPEPEPDVPEPEPVASDPQPEAAAASEPEPEPEATAASEPAPEAAAASEPEPEPEATAASEPEPEPEAAAASEPEPAVAAEPEPEAAAASEPEPVAAEPEPEPAASPVAPDPEPAGPTAEAASAADPEPAAPPPEVAAHASEPEPASAAPAADAGSAAAGAAAGAAAAEEKPKRRRSSGSRKVPKEAVAAAASEDGPPKVGDEVQLKVSGGKFDAGARGTVVDVFSAGVIVQLSDNNGNIERLDLPFEAVGPADA